MYRLGELLERDLEYEGGDFVKDGSLPSSSCPSIKVDGEELVFPITQEKISEIKEKFRPSPFGKGEATIVDSNVRNSIELQPSQFEIEENDDWKSLLGQIAKDMQVGLAVDSEVQLELYKMLVYPPGGKFDEHQDSLKSEQMFGTLIIQLPSSFDGGKLSVRHGEMKREFEFHSHPSKMFYVGFYAACFHEVLPIESGYRTVLVYNMHFDPATMIDVFDEDSMPVVDTIYEIVDCVKDMEKKNEYLAVVLDHEYAPASLEYSTLNGGKDKSIANALKYAQSIYPFVALTATINKTYEQNMGTGDGYGDEVHETESSDICFQGEKDFDGNHVGGRLRFNESAVYPELPEKFQRELDDEYDSDNDGVDDTGPTGNEGRTRTWWYESAVLLVVPLNLAMKSFGSINVISALGSPKVCPPALADLDLSSTKSYNTDALALFEFFVKSDVPKQAKASLLLLKDLQKLTSPGGYREKKFTKTETETLFDLAVRKFGKEWWLDVSSEMLETCSKSSPFFLELCRKHGFRDEKKMVTLSLKNSQSIPQDETLIKKFGLEWYVSEVFEPYINKASSYYISQCIKPLLRWLIRLMLEDSWDKDRLSQFVIKCIQKGDLAKSNFLFDTSGGKKLSIIELLIDYIGADFLQHIIQKIPELTNNSHLTTFILKSNDKSLIMKHFTQIDSLSHIVTTSYGSSKATISSGLREAIGRFGIQWFCELLNHKWQKWFSSIDTHRVFALLDFVCETFPDHVSELVIFQKLLEAVVTHELRVFTKATRETFKKRRYRDNLTYALKRHDEKIQKWMDILVMMKRIKVPGSTILTHVRDLAEKCEPEYDLKCLAERLMKKLQQFDPILIEIVQYLKRGYEKKYPQKSRRKVVRPAWQSIEHLLSILPKPPPPKPLYKPSRQILPRSQRVGANFATPSRVSVKRKLRGAPFPSRKKIKPAVTLPVGKQNVVRPHGSDVFTPQHHKVFKAKLPFLYQDCPLLKPGDRDEVLKFLLGKPHRLPQNCEYLLKKENEFGIYFKLDTTTKKWSKIKKKM